MVVAKIGTRQLLGGSWRLEASIDLGVLYIGEKEEEE